MRHLPNLLTLTNLFFGCAAIAFILNSQPFLAAYNGQEYWVTGTEQAYWGSICIGIAAICDLLDGLTARALKVFSPIGKDLDSLADLVTFGVAPSMILYKMLWASYMSDPNALDVTMFAMAPAFLVACFGALRLARFNTSTGHKTYFTGMPIPAVGMFIATLPLVNWYNPFNLGTMLQGKWLIYLLIAILCWLMVSKIRFFKLIPASKSPADAWPQIVIAIVGIAGFFLLKWAILPFLFVLYILLSIVYKPKEI
jgi:CDP-diacylglycerol--serine O-phosphatidyltransferase